MWGFVESAQEQLAKLGPTAKVYFEFSPNLFCRMIAKIAHCQAVATLGVDAFDHYLPGLILGRSEIISHYVGGAAYIEHPNPPEGPVSEISHELYFREGIALRTGTRLIAVTVRLFSNLNAPGYEAIVGSYRA
jgi:hypothetical protein